MKLEADSWLVQNKSCETEVGAVSSDRNTRCGILKPSSMSHVLGYGSDNVASSCSPYQPESVYCQYGRELSKYILAVATIRKTDLWLVLSAAKNRGDRIQTWPK